MLVRVGGSYGIVPLPSAPVKIKDALNLSDLKVKIDRKAEWTQIFNEAWATNARLLLCKKHAWR